MNDIDTFKKFLDDTGVPYQEQKGVAQFPKATAAFHEVHLEVRQSAGTVLLVFAWPEHDGKYLGRIVGGSYEGRPKDKWTESEIRAEIQGAK